MKSYSYGLVVLSYNHPELTFRTIASVLRQGYPENQILLVHNGSEKKHVDFLLKQFSFLQNLILEQNKGFSGGANAGLSHAFQFHPEVLFLTNDIEIISLPTSLNSNFDIATALIWKRNTNQVDSVMGGLNICTGSLTHFKSPVDYTSISEQHWIYPPGTAFSIKRDCFAQLGGFDESFHTYWEDVDLGVRARQSGFSIGHNPLVQLKHKVGKTCHKDRFYTLYLFQRNRKRLMKKHRWAGLRFFWAYLLDMLRLFFRICLKPNSQTSLHLWWKALYD